MKRGQIWTVAGGTSNAGKPRPAIIVQSDKFDAPSSITVSPLTAASVDASLVRFAIVPSKANGLQFKSYAMVDKLSTIPKIASGLLRREVDRWDIAKLNAAIALFLGLTDMGPE